MFGGKVTFSRRQCLCDVVGLACVVLCFAGTPVEVGITMYVLSISSLSEVKMVLDAFTVQHPPF
jgi:hypothetical protein